MNFKKAEKELLKILDRESDEKLSKIASLIIASYHETVQLNERLMEKNEALEKRINQLQEQFQVVVQQLEDRKEKERLLARPEPITPEIYHRLIVDSYQLDVDSYQLDYGRSYRASRLRLAFAILLVTGIRISELLPLKIGQVQTLFVEHWIPINRSKRGRSSQKAFLTPQGATILRERLSDLEFIRQGKDEDSYIFTAENSDQPFECKAFTNFINGFLKNSARKMKSNPNLSGDSFPIGFITQLWRDTNDIEFVKQTLGHAKIVVCQDVIWRESFRIE